ncbi:TPA: hypothetical protein ACNHUC_002668 [Enterococcus faecium]|uniref:hypothetical protein n=1 Tax=Enterococcus TaxID=1350 RepID=UPI001E5F75E3|nr:MULTISPECIES: hypothetical protein [Enterococcus]MCH3658312.1 hypothetical protein [Enterococcus faecium]MDW7939131.1 hypothetical protein [Enterococcus faecium]
MRKDVLEGVLRHIMNDIQPNYAALAKQYNCDYRTVKRYYEAGRKGNIDQLKKESLQVLLYFLDLKRLLEINWS